MTSHTMGNPVGWPSGDTPLALREAQIQTLVRWVAAWGTGAHLNRAFSIPGADDPRWARALPRLCRQYPVAAAAVLERYPELGRVCTAMDLSPLLVSADDRVRVMGIRALSSSAPGTRPTFDAALDPEALEMLLVHAAHLYVQRQEERCAAIRIELPELSAPAWPLLLPRLCHERPRAAAWALEANMELAQHLAPEALSHLVAHEADAVRLVGVRALAYCRTSPVNGPGDRSHGAARAPGR